MPKKFLITSALPYANGPIHFGHMAGVYLPADIYTKHKKMQGFDAIHISGSDEHGVAIMMNAQKAGLAYQEYVNNWHHEHKALFDAYQIEFDFFGQTSADYHKEETLVWFDKLLKEGLIERRDELQLQCKDCHNYLPDRFVQGKCYECGYEEARGDECPACGTWIEPLKLIDPECQFCKSKNIVKAETFQYHLLLSKKHREFRQWFETKRDWRKTVFTFVDSLSKQELVDRAITRDLDWGIDVPLKEAIGKKLYVWFDAPIGYVSNTKMLMQKRGKGEDYLKDWWHNDEVEISHFIGKDNIIFHAIIFPVMALASGRINLPTHLPANQYVNLAGKQFSKSKGHYVDALWAVENFGTDVLRYYLTTLIPEAQDSSFTWAGMEAKINGELANNIGNFVNRSMKFFEKNFPKGLDKKYLEQFFQSEDYKTLDQKRVNALSLLDEFQIKRSLETIMNIGQDANSFFSDRAPWKAIKEDSELAAYTIAGSAVYTMLLASLFAPFLPKLSSSIAAYFAFDTNSMTEIYNGRLEVVLAKMEPFNLVCSPEGLVPKIDPLVIKDLEAKLV
jgi:methionyl-tRNA synthetase